MLFGIKARRRIGNGLLAVVVLMTTSCPNILDTSDDLTDRIKQDVAVATASTRVVTIASSSYAVVTPTGAQEVKDGFPLTVNAVPFSTHDLIGWKKVSGTGSVVFSNPTSNSVDIVVTRGDASIEAILADRPTVLYTTPIGNSIAKNSPIAMFFSRVVDFSTINNDNIQILKNGEQAISGEFELLSDGKTVRFLPSANLSDFSNYVISISTNVKSVLDTDDPAIQDATVTNNELYLPAVYTAAFRTGNELDVEPPVNGAFSVKDISDDLYYSQGEVVLSDISATDDAGIAFYSVLNSEDIGGEYLAFDINDQPKSWTLTPGSDGQRGIQIMFVDSNGLESLTPVTESIYLDQTGPGGTASLDSAAGAPGFVGNRETSLTLSVLDPDVSTGVKGSGESTNGTDSVERKEMRFSNMGAFTDEAWEPYDTARTGWTLTDGGDGTRTVLAQFRDGIGNASAVMATSIYLDRTAPAGSAYLSGGTLATSNTASNLVLNISDGSGSGFSLLKVEASSGLEPGTTWTSRSGSGTSLASGTLGGDGSTASSFAAGASLDVVLDDDAADGSRTANLRAYDKVGNSTTITTTLILDRIPPTGGSILINGGNGGANKTNSTTVTVNVTGYASDALTGTSYMGFSNASTDLPLSWLPLATSASYTVPSGDGLKTIYAWFRDAVGNVAVSSSVSASITLDTSAPTGTTTIAPNPTASGTVTVSSNISGALVMRFSNNNTLWSTWEIYNTTKSWDLTSATYGGSGTNGTRYVYCQYSDNSGNPAAGNITSRSPSTVYDNTLPSATLSVNAGASYTNASTATLTISGSDNVYGSSLLQVRFSNNNATWSAWQTYTTSLSWSLTSTTYGGSTTNGTKTVYMQIKDPVGNTRSVSDSIVYDNVVPSAGTVSINTAATYANSATVTVGFSVIPSDATSGIAQIRYSNNNASWSSWQSYVATKSWDMTSATYGGTTVEGTKYVYLQVMDGAGNISSTRYDYIVYDITPPTGYFYVGSSANPATLYYPQTTLYFYMTDNLSGVAQRLMYSGSAWMDWETYSATKSWYLLPGNGTKYVYAYFKDGAGNQTAAYLNDSVALSSGYSNLIRVDIATDRTDMSGDSNTYMSTSQINLSDGYISAGQLYVYYTAAGRYGKMYVVSFNKSEAYGSNVLTLNTTTYNVDGTVYATKTNLKIRGTFSCDLDLGLETASGSDFFWRQDTSTTRYLVPSTGAKFFRWD